MKSTDRVEKTIVIHAPRSRVWRAISDAAEFSTWFDVKLDGPFVVGRTARGIFSSTQAKYDGLTIELVVEALEPEHRMAFKWHPHAVDRAVDYSSEPMTTVVFTLDEIPEGTRLTIVETGFDAIPAHRRAEAVRMNDGGWAEMAERVKRHVGG